MGYSGRLGRPRPLPARPGQAARSVALAWPGLLRTGVGVGVGVGVEESVT